MRRRCVCVCKGGKCLWLVCVFLVMGWGDISVSAVCGPGWIFFGGGGGRRRLSCCLCSVWTVIVTWQQQFNQELSTYCYKEVAIVHEKHKLNICVDNKARIRSVGPAFIVKGDVQSRIRPFIIWLLHYHSISTILKTYCNSFRLMQEQSFIIWIVTLRHNTGSIICWHKVLL